MKKIFIFLLILFCLVLLPKNIAAAGASLFLSPSNQTYGVNNNFDINIQVNSRGNNINAAEGTLVFNPGKLEVISISKSKSLFTLWTKEPSFNNTTGLIEFGGGTQTGFSSTSGLLATIKFKAKTAAIAQIKFSSGSVLASDGFGTNILTTMEEGLYTFIAPKNIAETQPVPATEENIPQTPSISSASHPDENTWYSNNNIELSWKIPDDVTEIKSNLDRNPPVESNTIYSQKISKKNIETIKNFENIDDGTWYFGLQLKNTAGWSKIGQRKILVDTQAPEMFNIEIDPQNNPAPVFKFKTADKTSGVSNYELKIDQNAPIILTPDQIKDGQYKSSILTPGTHNIQIKATDYAGNFIVSATSFSIKTLECPAITDIPAKIEEMVPFVVKGTSKYPNTQIIGELKNSQNQITTRKTQSDKEGKWKLIFDESLKQGDYQLSTRLTDSLGAQTDACHQTAITILRSARSNNYFGVILLLLAIALLCLLISLSISYRIFNWYNKLRRRVDLASQTTNSCFESLQKELHKQIEYLDNQPGLSENELAIKNKLDRLLNDIEDIIKENISNINKN